MFRFKQCREQKGLSQKFVALSLGVKAPSVSDWESGKTRPTLDNLVALAKLYGVSADALLGISEESEFEDANDLRQDEMRLLSDYRSLNPQGQEYIRQTVFMALGIYKKRADVPGVEGQALG